MLLNGIGGGRALWEPLRAALPADVGTISYDAPGCGASPPARHPLAIADQARIAAGVLEWAGVGPVDVLGFSFGGMVAQQLARDLPDAVRRLVLVATGPGVGSVPGTPLAYALLLSPHMSNPLWMRQAAPYLFGGGLARRPEQIDRHARRYAQPVDVLSYLGQIQAATTWTSVPWAGRVRQPTLVIAGDEDPLVPACNAGLLAALLPAARAHVVRGGGHLMLLDSAREVAPLITGFLAAADPLAGRAPREG
ncbi:poly(3-hydroxyalkanoate) depolymerase [Kineococcus glutinatus]|uniref:Poly(3-hydroxyalkanoate) depolymerase n=2 Tax=Kineococcus glutinatus TaxID=1070872 RepID=A0ABP9HXH2_9ACTN